MRNKVAFAIMCLAIISILATGCQTTTKKSSGIGAGIGTILGAGIGALLGDPGLGMAIGAGAGSLGGAVVGSQLEKKRAEAEKAELERQLEPETETELE
ncbi:MAG: glycine zipper domain-containing protein, partial [Candidatus Scalindua sp.]